MTAQPHRWDALTNLGVALVACGELADAENKGDMPAIKDAVGDVVVCLINYCALRDIDLVACLAGAYDEIKSRTGTLRKDGVFVKAQQ